MSTKPSASTTTETDPNPPPALLPNLPYDIGLQCIARVPRSHHPHLSLVSKQWKSLLQSPIFFSTRLNLNSTQTHFYLNFRIHCTHFKWYVLHPNPRLVFQVPQMPFDAIGSAYAVLGPKIFVIGGSIADIPSKHMWVFDARFNRWERGPNMRVGREFAAAGVVNGKVYVLGGCLVDTWARSTNWAEVFDPEIGSWATVPSPIEVRDKWMHASAVMGDRIYAMADRGGVVFDPREKLWSGVSTELDLGWRGRGAVVDGVLYCYDYLGKIRGFDEEEDKWKEVRGLEKGLPKFLCGATMANVGGRLVVVWEAKINSKETQISCAEIEVRKDDNGDLLGTIVWSAVILSVPSGSSIVHCAGVVV
ncbi:Kelch repeat type 1 [Dillenia turbinata]|uniref:Kelch repeat type 1 n=1 Tax=Dillenia turbinata TaxID=194707 RepID=A0AAN8Z720_9MAGN